MGYAAQATKYAQDVVRGAIPSSDWIVKACQRHLDDIERPSSFSYVYNADSADRACEFISHLPLSKGKWAAAKERFVLQPWQIFIVACLFGWVHKTTHLRRFREAFILVPRKNGKSELAAAISLYMLLCDGEQGAECYVGANTEKQAWCVFQPAKVMVQKTPDLQKYLGVTVNAKSLVVESTGSKMEPVIGKPGEGASPSLGVCDEFHEADDSTIYDVFKTGMGSREQPLLLVITTAGSNTASPCHDLQVTAQMMLDGVLEDDRLFAVIHGINAGTDWTTPAALRTANPNLDISVSLETLLHDQEMAVRNAAKANVFKTRHLNVWTNADVAFFNAPAWNKSADKSLKEEDFKEDPCYIGIDLASQIDLSAKVKVYVKIIDDKPNFYVFPTFYLPEDRINQPEFQTYQKWTAEGHIIATEGAALDYGLVLDGLKEDVNTNNVQAVCYDERYCGHLMQDLQKLTNCILVNVPQRTEHLSLPMKSLDSAILDYRVHHQGSPVLGWCMANVVAHPDKNENVFPNKLKPEHKIDGAVALINAMNRAITCEALVEAFDTAFFFG